MSGETGADIGNLLRGLREAHKRGVGAAIKAMDQFGEQVLGDAQQLCPVLTGALQASATAEKSKLVQDESLTKAIGFNTNYAAAVHENLNAHHDVGQAKFLETAIRDDTPKMAPFLAAEIKADVGG